MESYRVDIGGPHPAALPVLAFEGATKRNKPNLEVGALVYARVSLANKDMEPEIECINPSSGKADGFGELNDGFMIKCSLGMCRSLMAKNNTILAQISSLFPFETAIGMNGRVWINAETPKQIIMIANLIRAADGAAPSKVLSMLKAFKKQLDAMDDE
ncbi:exosome non-catalytic core subunit rrp40 [Batrachochytrium dendrobatidis]